MSIQPTAKRRRTYLVRLLAWVLLIAACSLRIAAQPQISGGVYAPSNPSSQAPAEKYPVTGTVMDAVSGEPLRKALVQLNITPRREAFTDSSGRFQFDLVVAGPVHVTAQKPGYFSEQEISSVPALPIDVGPNTPPAVIKLFPESVIYGKVTTSDGTPLEHVTITLTHANIRDGQRHWDNQGNTNTDEDGHYRFANLRPGTYYVGAGPYTPQLENLLAVEETSSTGYRGMYYPGAPDRASASPIQLSAGQQSEADLSLVESPVYRVSGVVTGYSPNQGVGLQVLDQSGVQLPVGVEFSADNGRFDVRGLPAGNYLLRATSQLAANQNVRAELPFSVTQDLHNLHLALSQGITIPVVVTSDSQPSAGRTRRSNFPSFIAGPLVSIRLIANGPPATDAFASVEGQPGQQTLIFRNVDPGRYSARIDPSGSWYVASAEYGQVNLLTDDLVLTQGAPPQELRITLRNDTAEITGTVRVPDGVATPVTIIAIPQTASKTSPRMTTLIFSRDSRGDPASFGLGSLAPGEYLVFAFDRINDIEYSNPDILQNYSSRAAHVTLSANQKTKVSLDLIHAGEGTN